MPSGVGSQTPGGALLGSCYSSAIDTLPQLVGQCPVVQISMGGKMVACLLDTGSMVFSIGYGLS